MVSIAHAALVNNGGGLIYDTDRHITWYDSVPTTMNWAQATSWAAGLTVGGTTAGSWRLPTALNLDGSGPSTTGSEMGHLYYTELGNTSTSGLANKGPFTNLQPDAYWTSTAYSPSVGIPGKYFFEFGNGSLFEIGAGSGYYALAVYDGNVGAPGPYYNLLISKSGIGSGTVTGPGINCRSTCSTSYSILQSR